MIPAEHIRGCFDVGKRIALLFVLDSQGSSPGRRGFSLVADDAGGIFGSIGGGLMEHKLVELARAKLRENDTQPFVRKQVHRKEGHDQSGLICSGEQVVAFYFPDLKDDVWVKALAECEMTGDHGILRLDENGITFSKGLVATMPEGLDWNGGNQWTYFEQVGIPNTLYILGGGHVGRALSEVMNRLGFRIEQFDDRDDLNTMVDNVFAHRREVIEYDRVDGYVKEGDRSYVAIVSFGYRSDKAILKSLMGKKFKYLGMMGSDEKVKKLFQELISEGTSSETLSKVHSPIGLPVASKTPEEIAISIAAQIIQVKNT